MFKMFGMGETIGIDLGTANVLVYVKGQGIVLNEPSVVAVDRDTNTILAVGEEARRMLGRTPGNIAAIRPLKQGVISDYELTEKMIKYFIDKAFIRKTLVKPTVTVCIPSGVTEVEKRAVEDAVHQAGARHVVLIGERTAEQLKINIGTAYERTMPVSMDVRGRNLITGLPKNITVTSDEMLLALSESANGIAEAVHSVLEQTPPELAADIIDRGIVMTGGGSLLYGLDKLIQERTKTTVMIADEAMSCVAIGTGKYIDYWTEMQTDSAPKRSVLQTIFRKEE